MRRGFIFLLALAALSACSSGVPGFLGREGNSGTYTLGGDAPEGAFYYFHDDAHTDYETWLDADTLQKFDWSSAELRRRFIEGPDSVVAQWLRAPYGIDGWRIDVAMVVD